ncbi:MAG: DUF1501 domain-containing protein [Gammaproteobacteria bacterium]|nr:DUF1501 domain-containing protein [Gammaproteobacteria bacterium]MYC24379.1 DUF1501 domain-containing protein [Gammaproteobacteria bacterium]
MLNRRRFLTHSCGLGVAAATASTTALTLGLTRSVAASTTDGYKALVCILLAGGNDSYNMLLPYDHDQYDEYEKIRSDLALDYGSLLPLSKLSSEGRSYALHSGMEAVRQIYEAGDLAFVANVGTMIEPVDAKSIRAKTAKLPIGLFSHSDQIAQWQSAISYHRSSSYGWGGRMADLLDPNPATGLSMNISLAGTNLFQTGAKVSPFTITNRGDGANTVWSFPEFRSNGINLHDVIRDLLGVEEENMLRREYSRRLKGAMDNRDKFVNAIRSTPEFVTEFSDNNFSTTLKQIARVIGARRVLGQGRQTFFVQYGGWDHHFNVVGYQESMLPILSNGLGEFRSALQELGEFDNVVTFTISDFGRTLTSNGQGSDHGWGGHHLVMGSAVNGGSMYGTYPELSGSSPLDVGRGIYIPTTSVEQYFAELALWLGVAPSDLDEVLPAVRNFYSPESRDAPLGFLV